MAEVSPIRKPITYAHVVQYLAEAPAFGKVIITFEAGAPVHLEIRKSVKLTGGAAPEPAQ